MISLLLVMVLGCDPVYHVKNVNAELPRYYVNGCFAEGTFLIPIIGGYKPSQVDVTVSFGKVTDLTLDYSCKSLHNGSVKIDFVPGIAKCAELIVQPIPAFPKAAIAELIVQPTPAFPKAVIIEPMPSPSIPALPPSQTKFVDPKHLQAIKPNLIEDDMLVLPSSVR